MHRVSSTSGFLPSLLLALLLLGSGAPAHAEVRDSVLLVLRVSLSQRHQERLAAEVVSYAGLSGVKLADHRSLRPPERQCSSASCLHDTARRHRASLVLTANIEPGASDDRLIQAWLLDVRTGQDRFLQRVCEPDEVEQNVKVLVGQLLAPYLGDGGTARAQPAAASPQDSPLPSPPPVAPLPLFGGVRKESASGPGRTAPLGPRGTPSLVHRSVAGALGTLAALSLISAITLTALDGKPASGCRGVLFRDCQTQFVSLYAAGYAMTGVFGTGLALSLALPLRK